MSKHPIQEGTRVEGSYHGIRFTGRVINWRVKYGGNLSYHVSLDHTIYLNPTSTDPRNEVLVEVNPNIDTTEYHGIREVNGCE